MKHSVCGRSIVSRELAELHGIEFDAVFSGVNAVEGNSVIAFNTSFVF
jgi:hypothetical protein